ncbi:prosaposin [Venturia canescens]|uniref:prosaposin n=1 Tax=Venturia canescens TaxID=32260 RepID=UPI001C9C21CD|nr:prosaposin [Venturia canescens]
MREVLFALCAILAVATARVVINSENQAPHLLGAKECTWGPSYWCQNITNAAKCKSTQHCIKKVWESMKVEDDKDSVCGICKDMVRQARDQLESNETQEDLKEVFEGSCALMQIKPIVRECDKLVDEFIPQLVETLASQMDPSVVCSVAGLCNSARIDRMIENHNKLLRKNSGKISSLSDDELEPDECSKCFTIATHMEEKFNSASRDQVLDSMLKVCGEMSSFSDACASIVLEYFSMIYTHLRSNFHAKNICHLSGQCAGMFHRHENSTKDLEVEIRPLSSVGMVDVGDDLPCELCEQLVGHLRDLLVANTTEQEFEHVLEGLCKQTKSFAPQCKSIVDEYYPQIYDYLVKGLDNNGVCMMAGICPSPDKKTHDGPIWPLLPEKSLKIATEIALERKNVGEHGAGTRQEAKKTEADEMQLPIERIMGPSVIMGAPQMDLQGKKECAFCEYFLHYMQQVFSYPVTEDELKQVMGKVCKKLPKSVQNTCTEFLNTYSDAIIALFVQEIDPSVICPMIYVCPSNEFMEAWEKIPKDLMIKSEVEEKQSCPLCLLAVTQLEEMVKNEKTEENIEKALEKLCMHLPKSLITDCNGLVQQYSQQVIEMLVADFSPQEVCVALKLCDPKKNPGTQYLTPVGKDGEILSNEIPDNSVAIKPVKETTKCVICEFIMQYLEKAMRNKSTKDEIEKIVHGVCDHLPNSVSKECNGFVDQYADLVIELLSQEVTPREICTILNICEDNMQRLHESIAECALCQGVISTIDGLLANAKVDQEIEEVVSRVCKYIAPAKRGKCVMMMEVYEQSIINILREHGDRTKICSRLALCSAGDYFAMMTRHKSMAMTSIKGTKRY